MAHFGGRFVGTYENPNATAIHRSFIVTSGVTITKGDFVYMASGEITNSSVAGAKLVGCADETVTGTATNLVKCMVIINQDALYLVDNDQDTTTFAATHVGTYFDLTGATGAQLVDTSTTTTTGSLLCVEYNPQIPPYETDLSMGLFKIAESWTDGRTA